MESSAAEQITDAAHRLYVRCRCVTDLGADAPDMDVHRAGAAQVIEAPNALEERFA